MNLSVVNLGTYECVAPEYYDRIKHPTCFNFRFASRALIKQYLHELLGRRVHEVGAGDSIVAELFLAHGHNLDNLVISDKYEKMLAYSLKYKAHGATLQILDIEGDSVDPHGPYDAVVASLGDPYNSDSFWSRVRHSLSDGGICIFTSPSYDWAANFRSATELSFARFMVDGASLGIKSEILNESEQTKLINKHRLSVEEIRSFRLNEFVDLPLSPKLLVGDHNLPIVSCYLVTKL